MTNVFISWSGDRSKKVAESLHEWLPRVINAIEPWLSSVDIGAGTTWHRKLGDQLEACQFGIICLTPENCNSPWLLYEAGGLSKSVKESRVVPFLIGMRKADVDGPLSHFQSVEAGKDGVWELLKSLNSVVTGTSVRALSEEHLKEALDVWWPRLDADLQEAIDMPVDQDGELSRRDTTEMTVEIVENTRNISRQLETLISQQTAPQTPPPPRKVPVPQPEVRPQPEVVTATRKLIENMLPDLKADAYQTTMMEAIDKWNGLVANPTATFDELNEALREAKHLRGYLDR